MRHFGDERDRLEKFFARRNGGGAGAGQAAFDIDLDGSGDEFGDAADVPPSEGASSMASMAVAGEVPEATAGDEGYEGAQQGVGDEGLVGMGWAEGVADGGADGEEGREREGEGESKKERERRGDIVSHRKRRGYLLVTSDGRRGLDLGGWVGLLWRQPRQPRLFSAMSSTSPRSFLSFLRHEGTTWWDGRKGEAPVPTPACSCLTVAPHLSRNQPTGSVAVKSQQAWRALSPLWRSLLLCSLSGCEVICYFVSLRPDPIDTAGTDRVLSMTPVTAVAHSAFLPPALRPSLPPSVPHGTDWLGGDGDNQRGPIPMNCRGNASTSPAQRRKLTIGINWPTRSAASRPALSFLSFG